MRYGRTRKTKPTLTQATLRALVDYDPATGVMRWKPRDVAWFVPSDPARGFWHGVERIQRGWNTKWAGKPIGARVPNQTGNVYLRARVLWNGEPDDAAYAVHQLAFLWMIGRFAAEVDHVNGDGCDNRWSNLREVTRSGNQRNRSRHRSFKGKPLQFAHIGLKALPNGTIQARIVVDGRRLHLGTFKTLDAAVAARKQAERRYGFSERHGRARAG